LVALGDVHEGVRGSDPNYGVIVSYEALVPALYDVEPAMCTENLIRAC
jgi:hypothetical protein